MYSPVAWLSGREDRVAGELHVERREELVSDRLGVRSE